MFDIVISVTENNKLGINMAEESILHDLIKNGLDPKKAHKLIGASGKLKKVEVQSEVTQPVQTQTDIKNGLVFLDKVIASKEVELDAHLEEIINDVPPIHILAKASTLVAAEQGIELLIEQEEEIQEQVVKEEAQEEVQEVQTATKRGRKKK